MKQICLKYVFVDLDGLLIDSEESKFKIYQKILASHGKKMSINEYKKLAGLSRECISEYLCNKKKLPIGRVDLVEKKKSGYIQYIMDNKPRPILRNIQVVRKLAKLYQLVLTTSQSKEITETILRRLKLKDIFRFIITGEKTKKKKPAPDTYLYAMKKVKADPSECIALEDTQAGVISAKRAGVFCIAIPNKFTAKQDLSKADKIFRRANTNKVINYIKKI